MGTKTPGRRTGGVGVVRLDAGANHSSEQARTEEEREEEMRSEEVRLEPGDKLTGGDYQCWST